MRTKLVELFANMVVERKNIIMLIEGGALALRMLGELIQVEFLSLWVFCAFELFLSSSLPFCLDLLIFMPFIGIAAFLFF
jgi:hypothetical protein